MSVSKVTWCDTGWLPYHYGLCPDERAWHREMKRLNVVGQPYPTFAGGCTHFENTKDHRECSIVTIAHDKRPALLTIGLIIHEAMHIWREIRRSIGEHSPSSEFEAYSMQAVSQNLICAYEKTRGKLCR